MPLKLRTNDFEIMIPDWSQVSFIKKTFFLIPRGKSKKRRENWPFSHSLSLDEEHLSILLCMQAKQHTGGGGRKSKLSKRGSGGGHSPRSWKGQG